MNEKDDSSLTFGGVSAAPPAATSHPTLDLCTCPWCGGPADFEETVTNSGYATFSVGCHDGDGSSVCFGYQSLTEFARKSEAAAAWNKRAKPADPGLIEAMLAFPSVDSFVREKEAEVDGLWKRIAQIANQTDPAWSLKLAVQFIEERGI